MDIRIKKYGRILPGKVLLDGELFFESAQAAAEQSTFLSAIYQRLDIDYRKFFKMDALSKAGFLLAELLLNEFEREQAKEDMGIVLFNRSSSLDADRAYQQTIQDKTDYFPSPAVFVYTLPNIVTGEIAIRNKIYGETAFYVLSQLLTQPMEEIIRATMSSGDLKHLLAGWLEVSDNTIEGFMMLCEAGTGEGELLSPEKMRSLLTIY